MYDFYVELVGVCPGAEYMRKKNGKAFEVGRIAGWAAGSGYKHSAIVNKDMKKSRVSVLHAAHVLAYIDRTLPQMPLHCGPTAYFKLTSVELTKLIYVGFSFSRSSSHNSF